MQIVVRFQYLFTNWTYLFINLFIACDIGIMSGFSVFGPKIVEVGFNLTPGQASALLGERWRVSCSYFRCKKASS